jgi:hypothetical protein
MKLVKYIIVAEIEADRELIARYGKENQGCDRACLGGGFLMERKK